MSAIHARFLGPDGEIWSEHAVPTNDRGYPPPDYRIPLSPRITLSGPSDPSEAITHKVVLFKLETYLPPADGGPLAIYRCRKAYT